jgi:biotin carboxylase
VAVALTDKFAQRQAFRAAGLQDLRTRLVHSHAEMAQASRGPGPVVVKPALGQGSRHTFRVAGPGDLRIVTEAVTAEELAAGYVVEDELPGQPGLLGRGIGDYVSVETVTVAGEHLVAGVVGRLTTAVPFRERGGIYPATLDPAQARDVGRLAVRALAALGIQSGVCHTEVKLTPGGAQILEVNGRLGGNIAWLIQRGRGPDLVRAALAAALGRRVPLAAGTPDGVAFRHLPPAPLQVGVVTEVRGVREVRALRQVESVVVKARTGRTVDWREGTGSCLAEISGFAAGHEDMVRCTDHIEELLRVSVDQRGGDQC